MANSSQSGNILGYASGTQPGLVSTVAQTFEGAKTFDGGLVFSASSLSDAQATILGLKQYLHGTTYNGGNAPTVTSAQSGFAVTRAIFIPYQCQDTTWRLKFNILAKFTSATVSTISCSINGITFKNIAEFYQSVSAFVNGTLQQSYVNPNTSNVTIIQTSTASAIYFSASGDVELNSKPTWAY